MGEIDTDSIKPVQASVSRFGEKCSLIKNRSCSDDESERVKDLASLLQDLANYKVQLEVKDYAYKQALLNQDHYEKTLEGLSTLLKSSELEKDIYSNECREARIRISELEFKIQETADEHLSETTAIRDQLSQTVSELLRAESQLVLATEAKLEAMRQAEVMETALDMEKVKLEELLNHVAELNETILHLRISSMETENEKIEVYEELERTKEKLDKVVDLENEILSKSALIDSLQSELQHANELRGLAEESAADSISELTRLKVELKDAKNELERMKAEENEAQVEIALLKAELHKGRSKTAAAEAAELRAKGEKSAAYLALQQIAIENQRLKSEQNSSDEEVTFQDSKSEAEEEEEITIPMEEYEVLMKKAEKAESFDSETDRKSEVESLKKDLESLMVKVREFRTRAEQASTRAEVAEQAKATLEEQIKRWKEQKQRRRAALAALREESMSKSSNGFDYEDNSKTYMPLGKFLKMKI